MQRHRQRVGAHFQRNQEILAEDFAGMNGAQRMADSFRRRIRTDLIGCNQCSQCGDKSFRRFDKLLRFVWADRVAAVVRDDAGFLRPIEQRPILCGTVPFFTNC